MTAQDAFDRSAPPPGRTLPYLVRCAGPRCTQVLARRIVAGLEPLVLQCVVDSDGLVLLTCPNCARVTAVMPRQPVPGELEAALWVDAVAAPADEAGRAVLRLITQMRLGPPKGVV
jgi:hypothetical protein